MFIPLNALHNFKFEKASIALYSFGRSSQSLIVEMPIHYYKNWTLNGPDK